MRPAIRRGWVGPLVVVALAVGTTRLAAASGAAGPGARSEEPVRLLRSDAQSVVLEITPPRPEVEGEDGDGRWSVPPEFFHWSPIGATGQPDLYLGAFSVGLPPDTRPEVHARVVASRLLPGPAPRPVPRYQMRGARDGLPSQEEFPARDEEAFSRSYPAAWAELGEVGTLRHLRVVTVRVFPYRWEPAARSLRWAEKLEVEVRFVPDPPPSGEKRVESAVPGPEDPTWERIYRRTVLNADQAIGWRRAAARWSRDAARGSGRPSFDAPEYRIRVDRSDFLRVPYEALLAAQWHAGPVPVDRLALVERFFDETSLPNPFVEQPVPILVRDLDGDGAFGPGDDFLFFALNAWDRLRPAPRDKRYGRRNAYYLSVREEGGARFATAGSYLDETLPVNASAQWRERFEGDGIYMVPGVSGDLQPDAASSFADGVNAIRNEHFYWFGGGIGDYDQRYDLPGILEPLGMRIFLQRTSVPTGVTIARAAFTAGPLPSGPLVPLRPDTSIAVSYRDSYLLRANREQLRGISFAGRDNLLRMTIPEDAFSVAVDWFEVTYRRDLLARDRRLAFATTGLSGRQEFRLLGFGDEDTTGADRLLVFDLTDSTRTTATLGPRLLSWRNDQYQGNALRLQLELGTGSVPRVLCALTPSAAARPAPGQIEKIDPLSPVWAGAYDLARPVEGDEDLICIVHPEFAEGIEPLLAARRAQGLVVRKVRTDQLFDQFNGGRPWPTAIRNYLRFLFSPAVRASAPSHLLLVGDASDDFANVTDSSMPNFVPTQTVFSQVPSDQGPELVACDYWFVDNLSGLGERFDFRPDMHVGRLPVGNTEELANIVRKLVNYGTFRETDAWRARGLFVSDDEFSSTISFQDIYRYNGDKSNRVRQNGESRFRWSAWQGRRIIQEEAGFLDFACDSFFTAEYMDTVAGNWQFEGRPVDLRRCRSRPDPCPTWPCPFGSGYNPADSTYACLNDVSAPYVLGVPSRGWWESNYWYGRLKVSPLTRQMLGRGYLFVSYQGHANARLLSHEYILAAYPCIQQDDVEFLRNEENPFVFFGFACHLAEFSAGDEGNPCIRDALAERMLFLDKGRGAVAAFASTAFEWIHLTDRLNLAILRAWFRDPPLGPDGNPRWVLGEIISQAKTSLAGSAGSDQTPTYNLLGDPSMPMEMAPPRLTVYVNCEPGESGCEPWEEASLQAEAGSDTVRIRSRLVDESGVRSVVLRDAEGVIDPTAYRLGPDPARPQDPKRRLLAYDRALEVPPENYELALEVRDGNGRVRSVSLPVVFGATFQVRQGTRLREIGPQDVLEPGDTLLVGADLPVDVARERLALWLDDSPLAVAFLEGAGPRRPRLQAVLPVLSEGAHLLRLRVDRPGLPAAERTAAFLGPGGVETRFLQVYNFPNPFEEGTRIVYRLNRRAISARVQIFTLSGRRIWSAEGPARANDNEIVWDGRDADGDEVANGVYLFRVEVRTEEGRTLSRIGRLARIR